MKSRMATLSNLMFGAIAAFAVSALLVSDVDARAGRSGSTGSRGSNTFSTPPSTNTAPKPAAPIEKSITQPGKATPGVGAATAGSATAAQASRFGGMKGLLLGGLFAAGLAGIFGVGAIASVLGFMLQGLLIGGALFLAYTFIRNRMGGRPALATAAAGQSTAQQPSQQNAYRASAGNGGAAPTVTIAQSDFNAFERLLGEVQAAYSRGDVNALGALATPEMLANFAGELDQNAKQGVRNELSGVKLLQGDLAEAWSEVGGEYATVAMRYAITDATVDAKTGRVVSGSRTQSDEVTEVWTFRRPLRGRAEQWELSAIQQA